MEENKMKKIIKKRGDGLYSSTNAIFTHNCGARV